MGGNSFDGRNLDWAKSEDKAYGGRNQPLWRRSRETEGVRSSKGPRVRVQRDLD